MPFTLLTHNAFWFQGMPFAGTDPGAADAEVLSGLAACYRKAGADVLCLQEIQSREAMDLLADALSLRGHYEPGRRFAQYGGALLVAECEVLASSSRFESRCERFWIKVRAHGLVVCNVHLPSGRQSSPAQAAAARVAELEEMLARGDAPDLVCGDFNEPPGGGVQALLEARGFTDLAAHAGAGERDTHTRQHARRVDYIWARRELAARLKDFHVGKPEALARGENRFLSDHLPLWARFE